MIPIAATRSSGVSAGNDMRLSPLYRAFIDAGVQAGYPETEDYNGEFQEGFGPMHMTVSGGVRESTARAYLKAVLNRPNLTLLTQHARIGLCSMASGQRAWW